MNPQPTNRIEVVDALRGIALFAIVIVHCFEHYNLYYIPKEYPQWLTALDKGIWDTTWFLMAGKAFSTFSLLFGLSFYIQFSNARKEDSRLRADLYGECFSWCCSHNCIPCSTTATFCFCTQSWESSWSPFPTSPQRQYLYLPR